MPVVKAHWADTNLSPGTENLLLLEAKNIGDAGLGAGFTITDQLPAGVHATEVLWEKYFQYSPTGLRPGPLGTCAIEAAGERVSCHIDDFDAALGIGDLAFQIGGYVQGHIYGALDPAQNYAIKTLTPDISALIPAVSTEVTIWGVPADPAHDFFRVANELLPSGEFDQTGRELTATDGVPWGTAPIRPFFTNPMTAASTTAAPASASKAFHLYGGTHRGSHPKFRATLKARPGDANIAGAQVTLPHSEFLDQAHIKTVCTRVQFAAKECPAASIYGYAVAKTPLFDSPLEGPVYLRSSSHMLPDLVAALSGPASQPVEVDLDGRVDSVNGGIRNSFELVPDAPVTEFTLTMQGGKKGLLQNSTDLCASTNRATAKFSAQNGKAITLEPALQSACAKGRKHNKHGHKGQRAKRHR